MLINMSQDNLNELNDDLIQFRDFLKALHNGNCISLLGKSLTEEGIGKVDYFEQRLNRWL